MGTQQLSQRGSLGKGFSRSVHTHITLPSAGSRVACILAPRSHVPAPGYTLTTLSDLWRFSGPHGQCIYELSLGLGSHTIHSFVHSTNIY